MVESERERERGKEREGERGRESHVFARVQYSELVVLMGNGHIALAIPFSTRGMISVALTCLMRITAVLTL